MLAPWLVTYITARPSEAHPADTVTGVQYCLTLLTERVTELLAQDCLATYPVSLAASIQIAIDRLAACPVAGCAGAAHPGHSQRSCAPSSNSTCPSSRIGSRPPHIGDRQLRAAPRVRTSPRRAFPTRPRDDALTRTAGSTPLSRPPAARETQLRHRHDRDVVNAHIAAVIAW